METPPPPNTPSPEALAFRAADDALTRADYSEAFRIAQPWAEKGHDWAECCVASLYHLGLGTEVDPAKAFYFYYRSAQRGNGGAWHALAVLFQSGAPGFPADARLAEHCQQRFLESGSVIGQPHKLSGYLEST